MSEMLWDKSCLQETPITTLLSKWKAEQTRMFAMYELIFGGVLCNVEIKYNLYIFLKYIRAYKAHSILE